MRGADRRPPPSPRLCWVGRMCFRAFVRFIPPLLLALFSPSLPSSLLCSPSLPLFLSPLSLQVSGRAMATGQPQGHLLAFCSVTNWAWGTRCLRIASEMKRLLNASLSTPLWGPSPSKPPRTRNCRSTQNGGETGEAGGTGGCERGVVGLSENKPKIIRSER